ncbi:phage tail family protein [Listeria sp. SHR_NRA_18]|uniref:phage distal tail protein n=1 Tax=Listeria sp. SHR_NRA_18 TaxID=2269046 RepID=UPI000F5FDCB0|nr:phage tail domain-containing protein [Listeria sp. SHR_NRA_18]RQW66715.1 phage tail family protein [Listeria sp. SHR_NRA_18]
MKIIIYNPVLKKEIVFCDYVEHVYETEGRPDAPFYVLSFDGLGEVEATRNTSKSPNQAGTNYLSSQLEERELSIRGFMKTSENTEEIGELRKLLAQVINPVHGNLEVIYEEQEVRHKILASADHVPTYQASDAKEYHGQLTNITLIANDPYWTDEQAKEVILKAFDESFSFSFEFPVVFGEQGAQETIVNMGHAATPITAELRGPSTVPRIENATTGQYMQLNHVLLESETWIIFTERGHKRSIIQSDDGTRRDVMSWLDLGSEFFSLQLGDNIIKYNASSGTGKAVALVKWKQKYIAI